MRKEPPVQLVVLGFQLDYLEISVSPIICLVDQVQQPPLLLFWFLKLEKAMYCKFKSTFILQEICWMQLIK